MKTLPSLCSTEVGRRKGQGEAQERPNLGQNDFMSCQSGTTIPLACRWRTLSVSVLGELMLPSIQAQKKAGQQGEMSPSQFLPSLPLPTGASQHSSWQGGGWVSPRDIPALLTVPESVPGGFECTDPTEGSGETQAPSYIRPKAQDGPTSSYKCPFSTRGASRGSGVEQRVEGLAKY